MKKVIDAIVGRPIRLNKQTIVTKKGKDYAEVIFVGDCHNGSPQFDKLRFLKMLDYCREKGIYVFLMGDLIEMATRDSIGAGVYEQEEIGQTAGLPISKLGSPKIKFFSTKKDLFVSW